MPKKRTTKGPPLSSYEKARLARIAENRIVMEQLGVSQAQKKIRSAASKQKASRKRPKAKKKKQIQGMLFKSPAEYMEWKKNPYPRGTRKSTRQRNAPPSHNALTDMQVRDFTRTKKKGTYKRAKINRELSPEQLANLETSGDWLDDFEEFLVTIPHGNGSKIVSTANQRTVMRQMRIFASGAGIEYRHWPEGVVFMKGVPVTIHSNAMALWQDAWDFEQEHGEDKGHGWLLLHPLTKLACYQSWKLGWDEKKSPPPSPPSSSSSSSSSTSSSSSSSSSTTSNTDLKTFLNSSTYKSSTKRKSSKEQVSSSSSKRQAPSSSASSSSSSKKKLVKKQKVSPVTSRKRSFSSSSSPSKRTKRSRYAELANGTKVKAKFQGKYYDGIVEKMFKNGSYDINFPEDNSVAKMKRSDLEAL